MPNSDFAARGMASTALKAGKRGSSNNALWNPPVMPDTLRGNGIIPSGYDPNEHLAATMDKLVDGEYCTKRSIGRDQTDTYDQWCYEFTPENPEKTILLTSMIHGNEYTPFYWMWQFFDLIINGEDLPPQLEYLKRNVKFVTVPISNPWGFANQSRFNVNGVDCSRNFNYNWGVSTDEYPQGSAPFSEAEARNIRDLMAEIAPETVASLDFHTTLSEGSTHHIFYYPRWLKNDVSDYFALVDAMKEEGETTAYASVSLPTLTNWNIFNNGINGANPEFMNGLDGGTRSSEEMTRAMKFFGNFVLTAANKKYKAKASATNLPTIYDLKYDYRIDGDFPFATTSYTGQGTKSAFKMLIKSEGVLEADGYVIVNVTEPATVSIMPQLYQVGSPDFDFGKTKDDERNAIIMDLIPGQDFALPFQSSITCHKSNQLAADNTNLRTQEAVFQLRTKISNGSGSIKFIKGKVRFSPSTSGDRFQRIGLNPTRIEYPTGEETKYGF